MAIFPSSQKIIIGLAAGLLIAAIAAPMLMEGKQVQSGKRRPLAEWLPANVPGWTSENGEIAETEGMKRAVDVALHYSDAVYRIYRRGPLEAAIYVAYWEPGHFNPRLISDHTPDICWVGVGWKMTKTDYAWPPLTQIPKVKRGQFRIFSMSGTTRYVVYWHLVGGKLSEFSERSNGRSDNFWDDLRENSLRMRGEQFFIRVSCNRPLPELWKDPAFGPLFDVLCAMGIADRS